MSDEKHTSAQLLELEPEAMRRLGYRAVDMIVDHYQRLPDKSATNHAKRVDLESRIGGDAPDLPMDPIKVLDVIERDVLSCVTHANHPRFFAYIPGPSSFVGAVGDTLAGGLFVSGYRVSGWLREINCR